MGFAWLVKPLLGLTAIAVTILSISLFLSAYIYYNYRPVSMVREPLYFNFDQEYPVAKLTLSSSEKQWNYLKRTDMDRGPSYLRTGSSYSFFLEARLAKSDRNRALAKVMATFTTFDATGDAVARAIRPVVLPWEHPVVTMLSSISTWPLLPFGVEANAVGRVELMNNYREPAPPTDFVEISLSSADFDIEAAYLSIVPETSGMSYLVYNYPMTSIILGAWTLAVLQLIALFIFGVVYYFTGGDVGREGTGPLGDGPQWHSPKQSMPSTPPSGTGVSGSGSARAMARMGGGRAVGDDDYSSDGEGALDYHEDGGSSHMHSSSLLSEGRGLGDSDPEVSGLSALDDGEGESDELGHGGRASSARGTSPDGLRRRFFPAMNEAK